MYSSKGGNSYPQQGYAAQSSYGQNPTSAYPGSSSLSTNVSSQLGIGSRHPSILGASHEPDIGGYRAHSSVSGPYGGQYSSLYGAGSLSSSQQVSALSAKGTGATALEGRGAYGSVRPHSPKYGSAEYVSSTSHGYTHRTDRLLAEKIPDYASIDRRQYSERQSAYVGRDLPGDATGRYSDSVGYAHHKPEIYDRIDQAVLREQMLKTQSLQSASHDSAVRQADYLAARAGTLRHPPSAQEVDPYVMRVDTDPRAISTVGRSSYSAQHTQSILGAAPQRNLDNLLYSQGSTNPGYGVSLPPGRDYGLGKGLYGSTLESDIAGSVSSRSGHSRIDDHKDERAGYSRVLDLRDEDRQREHLWERERDREREREKEKVRQRERERDRDRDRDRDREQERERERERERKHALELRERERDLQRRRSLDVRCERTPLRVSKDRHAPALLKDGGHRDSPRLGSSHRLHSPVKRREYVCKVYTASLVDVERDFLSVDKRYLKLYISPDFSKLVVNWPREELKLPFRTPVSFEHDFVEEESLMEQKEPFIKKLDVQTSRSGHRTVWNAKVILMSGLSRSAAEDLSSERMSDDRIPHICNLLRFAVVRKDRAFMAIGGPWDPIDGPDPSLDASSLIQTIIRHARDVAQVDLQNCKHWNRFLEIHYDRVGKDGLFSHREITVLFVPDLSDCLPSLDTWREHWLAHKKIVAERERLLTLKRDKEKREKKDDLRDKEGSSKDEKRAENFDKKKENAGTGQVVESIKTDKDSNSAKGKQSETGVEGSVKQPNTKADVELAGESNVKREEADDKNTQESVKPGKKKIVKRVVKQKVAAKKTTGGNGVKNVEKVEEKEAVDKNVQMEVSGQKAGSSADNTNVKTLNRKKVARRLLDGNPVQNEEKCVESAVNYENKQDASQDKSQAKPDSSVAVVPDGPVKKTIIRKIIKRVPKRKNATEASGNKVGENKNADKDDKAQDMGNDGKKATEASKSEEKKVISDVQSETKTESRADGVRKEDHSADEKKASGKKVDSDAEKQSVLAKDNHDDKKKRSKENEKIVEEKDKRNGDGKDEERRKSGKEVERKKSEEPPRHPGLILQAKSCKGSKVHSLSLSLDSLLDYSDKDVEEPTFELSLFAESLYEMLQYQMGSRILVFLQKLRINFVLKRNRRKRQREEADEKQKSKESSTKRVKGKASPNETKSTKSEAKTEVEPGDEKSRDEEEKMEVDKEKAVAEDSKKQEQEKEEEQEQEKEEEDGEGMEVDKEKVVAEDSKNPKKEKEEEEDEGNKEDEVEEEVDYEEDPEEDPEEDEEVQERSPQDDSSGENHDQKNNDANMKEENKDGNVEEEKNHAHAEEPEKVDAQLKKTEEESAFGQNSGKDEQMKSGTSKDACEDKTGKGGDAKEKTPARKEPKVDKELLEAFRFFDRNRVGYIRLEDMRSILHNLGKYLSHRDVKELAQSALLESNTGRDDRILYEKLVRMTGLDR